jgi:tetratricopeptide (TPR) repeat protein/TolB-like protein
MNRIDQTTQRENRRLIAVYLKNADKYLKEREFERAAEEVDRALAIEVTNEYVQAYKERILELRHGTVKQAASQREVGIALKESVRKKKREEPRETPVERKRHDAESEKRRLQEEGALSVEFEKRTAEGKDRKRRENGEGRWVEELTREKAQGEQLATYLEQAEEFLRQEQFDKARVFAEKAFTLDPRDPRAPSLYTRIREGMLSARQRKAEKEEKQQEIRKKLQTYIERATNYLETGKLEKALDDVGEATSIDPANAELNRLSERIREAIELRQRAREEEARRKLEEEALLRREAEERRRQEEEARLLAEEEARRQAERERIAELLQKAREYLEKDKFKKALDEVESVFKLSPDNIEAIQLRETILLREEEKRRAEEEARQKAEEEARRRKEEEDRLRLERRILHLIQSAEVFFVKGKFEKALSELNNAYVLDPDNAEVGHFVERIERTIEERQRAEQAEKLKREEEERRRFEEEALRRREQEEQRRRQEEERRKAEEESRRQARLLRVHGYLAKALEELTTVRAVDPLNANVSQLENALREAFEKADKAFPGEEKRAPAAIPSDERRGEFQVRHAGLPVRSRLTGSREPGETGVARSLPLRETVTRAHRASRVLKRSITRRKFVIAGIAVFAMTVASVLLSRQLGLFSERKVLLVMPLGFSSPDSRETYLGEALMTGIVSDFSAVPELSVFNEGTAYALRQSSDAVSAARRVHATHVLQGTIEKEGGRLVVTTRLNEALTGKSIWSKELSASPQDFVVVRNSIFDGVLEALHVHAPAAKPSARGLTNDPVALDSYWKGRAELLGSGEEDFHRAIKDFDEALARDGRFALALAGKAAALLNLYKRNSMSDPRWLDQAEQFSAQALQINDQIALAHRTLGSALVYGRNYSRGMKEIQTALALEPNNASAYRVMALAYAGAGDQKNAVMASETALTLDPLNFESYIVLGLVNHSMGNYTEASTAYEQAIAFEPGAALGIIGLLDNALLAQGSYRRALSLYETFLHLHPDDYEVLYKVGRAYQLDGQIQVAQPYFTQVIDLAERELRRDSRSARAYIYLALAQTRMGRYSQARGFAKKAIEIGPQEPIVFYGMAYMFSIQNESGAALEWFRKAVSTQFSYQQVLDVDLLNVRTDLAFAEILHSSS